MGTGVGTTRAQNPRASSVVLCSLAFVMLALEEMFCIVLDNISGVKLIARYGSQQVYPDNQLKGCLNTFVCIYTCYMLLCFNFVHC